MLCLALCSLCSGAIEPACREDLAKNPNNAWAHLTLAMTLFCLKDAAGAVPHFQAALKGPAVAVEAAVRYRAACCYEDAVRPVC